jgi:NTP pyrophosphatase (non-canonical NTP hydrolase)
MSDLADVLGEVAAERRNQDLKWGVQNHPNTDQVLITRPGVTDANGHTWAGGCTPQRMAEHYEIPVARRAKFLCQSAASKGECTYAHILIEEVAEAIEAATIHDLDLAAEVAPTSDLRDELLQIAAVAVAWVEKLDREVGNGGVAA